VARAFVELLRGVRPGTPPSREVLERVLPGAAEFAQLLSLPGLAGLLTALQRRAPATPTPRDAEAWRVLAAALDACDRAGDLMPLADLEPCHRALAEELALETESAATETGSVRLELALEGLDVRWPREWAVRLAGLPLETGCAAALRATLDWLMGDAGARLPVEVSADDCVVEVTLPRVSWQGMEAAGRALMASGGTLAPSGPGATAWKLRVPWRANVPSYLLVELGELSLALPWWSVLRVSMMSAQARDALARRMGWPSLNDLMGRAPLEGGHGPVVLVGQGLRRALLVVDRLVWRMPCAEDPQAGAAPVPWLGRGLRTADDDRYWEVAVERLLDEPGAQECDGWWRQLAKGAFTAPPQVWARRAEPRAPEPEASAQPPAVLPPPAPPGVESVPAPEALAPPASSLALPELSAVAPPPEAPSPEAAPAAPGTEQAPAAHAEPAEGRETTPAVGPAGVPVAPAAAPVVDEPARPVAAPIGAERPGPAALPLQVLVAEDSITAAVFLARLLEEAGARCRTVETLAALRLALEDRHWDVLCVDVDLPDAGAGQALGVARAHGAPVVALVRDAFDEDLARRGGAVATLLKPFDAREVRDLLRRLAPGGER
jgi:CheY-like chemotaxis protein